MSISCAARPECAGWRTGRVGRPDGGRMATSRMAVGAMKYKMCLVWNQGTRIAADGGCAARAEAAPGSDTTTPTRGRSGACRARYRRSVREFTCNSRYPCPVPSCRSKKCCKEGRIGANGRSSTRTSLTTASWAIKAFWSRLGSLIGLIVACIEGVC